MRVNQIVTKANYAGHMTKSVAKKPEIVVRNQHFGAAPYGSERWYVRGDPVPTAFFSALSAVFPEGEQFFIESVRPWRKQVDPKLRAEINHFIKQEALHTREHDAFNEQVQAAGYENERCEQRAKLALERTARNSPMRALGITIALEHFTAMFANVVLTNPDHLSGAPDTVKKLWRWHALEEIEHKAVVFDTFMFVTRDWSAARRYAFRVTIMLEASLMFAKTLGLNMRDLYGQDDLRGLPMVKRTLQFLLKRNGILTEMMGGWFSWFKPNFHPWQHDDSDLVNLTKIEFASEAS